jgi:transaldolase
MKIFLDTARLEDIKEAVSWGVIDGITTNPPLIKNAVNEFVRTSESMDMDVYIKNILAAAGRLRPVFLDVAGLSAEKMIEQGVYLHERFNQVAGNVVIKIPVCPVNSNGDGDPFDGIIAIGALKEEKVPVNATLIFTPEQALLAAKAGADYVTPYAGRIDDRIRESAGISYERNDYFPKEGIRNPSCNGEFLNDFALVSGIDLVTKIVEIFNNYEMECEIIAASLRNPIQVREAACAGAHIATMPFEILKQMIVHPGSAKAIGNFREETVEEYLKLF